MRYYQLLDEWTNECRAVILCQDKITPDRIYSELSRFGNNIENFLEHNSLGAVHVKIDDIHVPEEFNIESDYD